MEITQLVPDDWELFRKLRIAALSDAPAAFSSTLDDELELGEADWRAKLATRAQFVARDGDGSAVGTVGAYHDGEAIELISMWVAPAARGQGIGAALVRRVLGHAREIGCREVYLWVTSGNAVAEQLYGRCGFTRTGTIQPIRPGEPALEVEMRAAPVACETVAADAEASRG